MHGTDGPRFRIVVERIDETPGPADRSERLSFEVCQHDDSLAIVRRVRAGTAFSPEDASALALGVKLFSGVMLAHRDDPLFAAVLPAMRAFTGNLKSRVASSTTAAKP